MAQLLVRNLDEPIVAALKARAAAHGRSLEQECRLLLAEAARPTRDAVCRTAAAIRALGVKRIGVSLDDLVREDRDR
jgi:plasmid stability protein